MLDKYVEEYIKKYSAQKKLYEKFAEQILNILKVVLEDEYSEIKIASFSKRVKDIESLRKKLTKDKYNQNSEITDLAGVRVITYSKKDIEVISKVIGDSFIIDAENSVNKTSKLGTDKVGYRGSHFIVSFDESRLKMPENKKYAGMKCEIQVTSLIAHTWSEITHEKGYKFEGRLPDELQRRINLLAGLMELADMEMDSYVELFDRYSEEVQQEVGQGILKHEINSVSLEEYMNWKFPYISPHLFRDIDLILEEIKAFGISKIDELDAIVKPEYNARIESMGWRSMDGIIRNILIIHDSKLYFSKVWNPSMIQMNRKNYELYKDFGIDIEKICSEKNIDVNL